MTNVLEVDVDAIVQAWFAADLTGVKAYRSAEAFVADQARHLNDPSWFQPPCLYGFIFANPRVLPFRAYKGNVRFFRVEDPSELKG